MAFRRIDSAYWHLYNDSNLAQIKEFLNGRDSNYQYFSGVTLLHEAVNIPSDNINVVSEIIKSGANVNIGNHLDITPLHNAVFYRKRRVVEALIQAGASINAKDFLGSTILHLAVTKWILHLPPTVFAFHQDMWILDKLLKHESIDCNPVDSNGETPLMLAIKDEHLDTVVKLLENNADPNISNDDLETSLHVAFSLPLSYIQIKLLLGGANIYTVNKNGETPMDVLIKKGLKISIPEWVMVTLKLIAFKYSITDDLKRKFFLIPHLSKFFRKCCDEVDRMRSDFVTDKLTVHDFIWKCFDENDYENILMQIHKPLVERIVGGVYSEYFIEILDLIPEYSLFSILQMAALSKKHSKTKENMTNLADLFSTLDVIYLFSDYFWNVDIFCLIVAFSDVIVAGSKRNLYDSYIFHIFD